MPAKGKRGAGSANKNMDELSGKVRENADRRRLLEEKQQKLKDLEALLVQAKRIWTGQERKRNAVKIRQND